MDTEATRVIVSDLHIGRADRFDIFKLPGKTDSFRAFLKKWDAYGRPVELIINGDFVDFLQLQPWKNFPELPLALTKITEITKRNASVFSALGEFLQDPKRSIHVLLGNHDVELSYKEVWEVVAKAVGIAVSSGRLRFEDRRLTYNPVINGVYVAIEHGNKRDPWNDVRYPELFSHIEKGTPFKYPPGTQFVYDVMNEFKTHFRFVDVLKPEMPAVPLLLMRLRPLEAARKAPVAAWDLLVKGFGYGLISAIRRAVGGPRLGPVAKTEEMSPEEKLELAYETIAADYLGALTATANAKQEAKSLEDFLQNFQGTAVKSDVPTFGRRWDSLKNRLKNTALRGLGRPPALGDTAFYSQNHPDKTDVTWAKAELVGKVQVVVFGHTHRPLKNEFGTDMVYLNSGTWANLIELPAKDEDFPAWLEKLANDDFDPTSFPTYITLEPEGDGVLAELNHWDGAQGHSLWGKHITASK